MAKGRAHADLYARLETKEEVKRNCTDGLGRDTKQEKMYSM